jgi:hypothetical protein
MRIDGTSGQVQIQKQALDILNRMNVGDVVRARVIEMTSNDLVLKLFDGSTFNASTLTNLNIKPGDMVDFLIKEKQDSKFVMETVKADTNFTVNDETQTNSSIQRLFSENNIENSIENIKLASGIRAENLTLDKNSFDAITDILKTIGTGKTTEALFMYKNGIYSGINDINTLTDIINGRFKLGNEIKEILVAIKTAINEANPVIQSVSNSFEANSKLNNSQTVNVLNAEKQNIQLNLVASESEVIGSLILTDKNNVSKEIQIPQSSSKIMQENTQIIKENTQKNNLNAQSSILDMNESNFNDFSNLNQTNQINRLTNTITSELVKNILNQGKIETNNENIETNLQSTNKQGHNVNDLKNSVEKLFTSIDKEMNTDDLKPKNIYENTLKALDIIKESVKSVLPDTYQNLLPKIENIESGMKFLSQINQYNAYVQIPLSINNFNTSGEMYIFKKNNKKKNIDSENVSMLVCLDTQNMGRVDSMVNVKNKNINIQMRIEDSTLIKLIKDSVYLLHEALNEKGFKLVDLKCNTTAEVLNPSNAEKIASSMIGERHTRIDMTI